MGKRERKNWTFSLEESGTLILLGVLFLFGGIVGCFFSQVSISAEHESLVSYLADYVELLQKGRVKKNFWNIAWNELRYVLFIVLFGMTPVRRVAVPLVVFLRGFFLSFSIGCLIQVFGLKGVYFGLPLFLMPAFFWGPALFLAAYCVVLKNVTSFTDGFWNLIGLCGALFAVCIGMEYWVVPVLLRAIVRVVFKIL